MDIEDWSDSYYSLWKFNKGEAHSASVRPVLSVSDWKDPARIPTEKVPLKMPWTESTVGNNIMDNISIWPLIIIGIVVFLVWTEYGSQDCRQQNCNNTAKTIYSDDNISTAISKTIANVQKNHTIIGWRRSLLVAIIIALVILFIFCPGYPDGFTVLITIILIFFLVYFSSAWFQAHWWKFNDYKIEESLKQYRSLHST